MKNLKKQTVCSLFFISISFFLNFLHAQTILSLNNDNLVEVVEYIDQNYSAQMGISQDELTMYLEGMLNQYDISTACPAPEPQIVEHNPGYISFWWSVVPEAVEYNFNYINLVSGLNDGYTTPENFAEADLAGDLHLFGFQSVCEPELIASQINIIIVDKDILFWPHEVRSCDCSRSTIHEINIVNYPYPTILPTAYKAWEYSCSNMKYKVTVSSQSPGYLSKFTMVHQHSLIPDKVLFNVRCFDDFEVSQIHPVFAGDPNAYFLSFTTTGFTLHFTNLALANTANVKVEVCDCDATEGPIGGDDGDIDPMPLIIYPNPFGQQFMVEYYLETPGEVQLKLFDALNREVYSEAFSIQDAGLQQFDLNLKNKALPQGIYHLILRANHKTEIIKAMKISPTQVFR